MNKKFIMIFLIILIVGGLTAGVIALYPYNPTAPPLALEEGFTESGMQEVVSANNEFAFDLYNEIKLEKPSDNILFSPYSLSSAFAMVYEGAKENTKEEIKEVFHFPETNILRPNFAAIYNQTNALNKNYLLRTGNALWVEETFPLIKDYSKNVESYYGGKSVNLDFINKTEASRKTINDFISEQTNKKIPELIEQGILSPVTRLVLTNAIYFEGEWLVPFNKSHTKDLDFKTDSLDIIKSSMMVLKADAIKDSKHNFKYADLNSLQILEFPYKENLVMTFILPSENIASLGPITLEKYNSWKDGLENSNNRIEYISFPKFKFDTEYTLNEHLIKMGMPDAFNEQANFQGISKESLFISIVIHKAYIEVDEQGTKAAAATAVVMDLTSIGPPSYRTKFIADHPFLFLIEDNRTGEILFLGEVNNPSS